MADKRELIGTGVIISYPLKRVFAFTNYHAEIATTFSAGTAYTVSFNGTTIKRYLDTSGGDILPLSGMFKSFFSSVDFGILGSFSGYKNAESKLMSLNNNIVINISSQDFTLNFDIIWGALQPAKREKSVIPIYMFAGLPLTITQNIGDDFIFKSTTVNGFGKEVLVSGISESSGVALLKNTSGTETYKTYNVSFQPCVPDNSIYLRWVDIEGEYKYYLLNVIDRINTSELGYSYNLYPSYLNPTPSVLPELVKNRIAYVEKKNYNRIIAGVMAADDNLTEHLQSLNGSLLQWIYSKEGSNERWTEVVVSPMSISRKTREGNRQIDFEIQLPEPFTQRL